MIEVLFQVPVGTTVVCFSTKIYFDTAIILHSVVKDLNLLQTSNDAIHVALMKYSSIFKKNYESLDSEFPENLEEMFFEYS